MKAKPTITIVGPGNLGTAIARALVKAGYRVDEIVYRAGKSEPRARLFARRLQARAVTAGSARFTAGVIWITVGDADVRLCAAVLARIRTWKGKSVFHASGALTSHELETLRQRGASVASVHPMMTFVPGVQPDLRGVVFAIEGDSAATRAAEKIATDLGGTPVRLRPRNKPLYHAFGAFTSPLVVATLAAAEQVARRAGLSATDARAAIAPILQQTVRNFLAHGAAGAFSGPLVRGDVATVRTHLRELKRLPEVRAAYVALARIALNELPVRNRRQLSAALK